MAGADTSRDEDELEEAQAEFERFTDAWSENYNDALEDFRFGRLGQQWPEQIRKQRQLEGRPCLTINKLPAFIRQVVNDARQNKPAITVHPADDQADPETAEVFNGIIRHIERSSDADVAYDTGVDNSATGGFGWIGVNTRYTCDDSFEQDIVIEAKPNAFAVLPDPDSTAADSSDWMGAFEVYDLPKKRFEAKYPDADAVSFGTGAGGWRRTDGDEVVQLAHQWVREEVGRKILAVKPTRPLSDDERGQAGGLLPPESMILDEAVYAANKDLYDALGFVVVGQPREVMSYKVTQKVLSGADVLERKDWAGKWIPIVPVYGEDLNVEGKRRLAGMVRDAADPQRMFNYWRTTSTELVALAPKAPFIGRKGAFETDAAKWATANTQSHAYIEYDVPENGGDIGPPQRQAFAGIPAGALQEALNASDDMKAILGLYDASVGARSNETSGRAILARQREGDVSTFNFQDNVNRAIRHVGRIVLDLIPKVYSTPRMQRILGPDGSVANVQLAPKDQREAVIAKMQARIPQPVDSEQPAPALAKVYSLDVGKYDLVVTAGPSFTTRREEAANQMIEFIRAYPAAAPLIGDLLAKNLDWPGAEEVADRLKAMLPAQLQGENPEAQAAKAQIEKMAQMIGQLRAELAATKDDNAVDRFNAETNRMKALAPKGVPIAPEELMPAVLKALQMLATGTDIDPGAAPAAPPQQPPLAA